jgi:hypothetical protein
VHIKVMRDADQSRPCLSTAWQRMLVQCTMLRRIVVRKCGRSGHAMPAAPAYESPPTERRKGEAPNSHGSGSGLAELRIGSIPGAGWRQARGTAGLGPEMRRLCCRAWR